MNLPFRFRYWLFRGHYTGLTILRNRFNPESFLGGCQNIGYGDFLDGPFDTQEDAVRAMAFWSHQLGIEIVRHR